MRGWWSRPALGFALVALLAACGGDSGKNGSTAPEQAQGQGTPATAVAALPAVTFHTAGGATITMRVEVADTDELRTCGLMHRLSMPDEQGMLFVFQTDASGPFWNRNTFIPLTLAWIAADETIVDLTDMPNVHPQDNPQPIAYIGPRPGSRPYRYVIEANQGWFSRHKVSVGDHAVVTDAVAHGSQGAVPICREKGL